MRKKPTFYCWYLKFNFWRSCKFSELSLFTLIVFDFGQWTQLTVCLRLNDLVNFDKAPLAPLSQHSPRSDWFSHGGRTLIGRDRRRPPDPGPTGLAPAMLLPPLWVIELICWQSQQKSLHILPNSNLSISEIPFKILFCLKNSPDIFEQPSEWAWPCSCRSRHEINLAWTSEISEHGRAGGMFQLARRSDQQIGDKMSSADNQGISQNI